ncbi:hypothetical protein [Pseudoxanthomonas wuyuanensis]|uniref:Uncharacterized protein n=1 Tax=Pseudoxanthomonas wuyuanensis TaxID=1073196 RepID=A0A286DBM2_9GAMM|nr:hypothetical protein [Pseudoxanthomonas wuyuanensis]SOD56064.1 hypothetical protein SAMN06296416_108157 [Pseudoxanthomonas wuyuanensis]
MHSRSDQVNLLDDNAANVSSEAEGTRATKSQRTGREQKTIDSKQRKRAYQQWDRNERLRVANEAARREAERMIDAASPMDWRNRYSSD